MNFKVGDEVVVIAGSDKGKKGKIIKTDDEKFVFEISPDKNGNIPAVNFEEINKGTPVKILSK